MQQQRLLSTKQGAESFVVASSCQ